MRVYELMDELHKLPAGAEVRVRIYLEEDMDIFAEESERSIYVTVNEVELTCNDNVHLYTSDVEI